MSISTRRKVLAGLAVAVLLNPLIASCSGNLFESKEIGLSVAEQINEQRNFTY